VNWGVGNYPRTKLSVDPCAVPMGLCKYTKPTQGLRHGLSIFRPFGAEVVELLKSVLTPSILLEFQSLQIRQARTREQLVGSEIYKLTA